MGGTLGALTSTGAMTGGLAGKNSILKHPTFTNLIGGGTGIADTGVRPKDNTNGLGIGAPGTILSQGATASTLPGSTDSNNDSLA